MWEMEVQGSLEARRKGSDPVQEMREGIPEEAT